MGRSGKSDSDEMWSVEMLSIHEYMPRLSTCDYPGQMSIPGLNKIIVYSANHNTP